MRLVSVNVGLPREVEWNGKTVTTGFFKEPVAGRVAVRTLNLDGDRQADLTVHGGVDKAVYAYPSEHYQFWQHELPDTELPWGMFGENLTTAGLDEEAVNIGDRFRIGTAELMVTQPRTPCYKLDIRFGRTDMVKRFLANRRCGIYFSVVQEGELGTGDALERIHQDENQITVADINRLFLRETEDAELLYRVTQLQPLAETMRDYFKQRV